MAKKKRSETNYMGRYADIDRAIAIFDKKLGTHGSNLAAEAITNRPEKIIKGRRGSNAPTARDVDAFIRAANMVDSGKLASGGEVAFDTYRNTLQWKWMRNWKGTISDKTRAKYEAMGFNVPTTWNNTIKGEIALRAATRSTKGTGGDFFDEPNLPASLQKYVGSPALSPERREMLDVYQSAITLARRDYRNSPLTSERTIKQAAVEKMNQEDRAILGEVFSQLKKLRGK